MRRAALTAAVVAAALVLPSVAAASWQSAGDGSGYARAQALAAGNTPTATAAGNDISVSWTATSGTVPASSYSVARYNLAGQVQTIGANCAGAIATLSCTENDIPPGDWRYTVTPARGEWRGSESSMSTAVTVAPASPPALTLDQSTPTCLPATLTGQITSFAPSQTVTFRLDNAATGQLLSGSITPTPVPANGTASVSVTIPTSATSGTHTVYAIGSGGDVASASFTLGSGIRVASGSYTGNGTDNRAITDLGFRPDLVIVKSATAGTPDRVALARSSTMPADRTKRMGPGTVFNGELLANLIQSLDADGFTVGSDARANASGGTTVYEWVAIKALAGHMALGSYAGNGGTRAITGLGFSPEYVMILSGGNDAPAQRMQAMTSTYQFDAGAGFSGITSLDANGFTVGGSDGRVNSTFQANYHYVAFNECGGEIETASYSGDGAASRDVTSVGFQPDYTILHAANSTGAGVHRTGQMTGTGSLLFTNDANISNGITSLLGNGFRVGNNASTNANGVSYPYVAFRDRP